MNSEPLSEPVPNMGRGSCPTTCSIASKSTPLPCSSSSGWLSSPVAMTVTVRVKQNSPDELPPSWPTRSISTKPAVPSAHSAQVRTGIWGFNRVPGLVWAGPRATRACSLGAKAAVDRRCAHGDKQRSVLIGHLQPAFGSQQRDQGGEHGSEPSASGSPADPPAGHEGRGHLRRVLRRRRCPSTHDPAAPASRSRARAWSRCHPASSTSWSRVLVLSVLDLTGRGRQLLCDCLSLPHRKLHDYGATAAEPAEGYPHQAEVLS
jgi:hypothetical protein